MWCEELCATQNAHWRAAVGPGGDVKGAEVCAVAAAAAGCAGSVLVAGWHIFVPSHCWPHQHRPSASMMQVPVPQQRSSCDIQRPLSMNGPHERRGCLCQAGPGSVARGWPGLCANPIGLTAAGCDGRGVQAMHPPTQRPIWAGGRDAFCVSTQNVLTSMPAASVTEPKAAMPYLEANNSAKTSISISWASSGTEPRLTNKAMTPPGTTAQNQLLTYLGRITASMTWMTPLSATMSVFTTLAASTFTPPVVVTVMSLPCTVLTLPASTSAAITLPGTTW